MRESGVIASVDVRRMPSEDLAALLNVSSMLAATLDLPSIMQTAIDSACEVVDVYDALISNRPYRSGWSHEQAIAHIREQTGRHFDPKVVEAFLAVVGDPEP
jgi:hypothetical protein